MDFYTLGMVFLSMVVYQTAAKKLHLPLLSNGLEYSKDRAVTFFDWLGELTGRWLNIYEWARSLEILVRRIWRFIRDYVIDFLNSLWKWVRRFVERAWRFFVDHLWGNIKPFFESVAEIVSPAWKLCFSWGYFFVGFAKTHYIFFSWIGGAILITVVGYFTHGYWMYIDIDPRFLGGTILVLVIGVLVAFPDILPQMFPRVVSATITLNEMVDTNHVVVNGVRHEVSDLRQWTLSQLTELLEEAGRDNRGLPRRKESYIDRLREVTYQ